MYKTGGSNSNNDKVLLEKVTALTLEQGKMTTGRRSSPVQQVRQPLSPLFSFYVHTHTHTHTHAPLQMKCVGGSAGCSYAGQPRVVQCHNRGFDGYDVQVSHLYVCTHTYYSQPFSVYGRNVLLVKLTDFVGESVAGENVTNFAVFQIHKTSFHLQMFPVVNLLCVKQ